MKSEDGRDYTSNIVHSNSISVSGDQREYIEGLTVEYPYVMHHTDLRENSISWHWHEEVEFGWVVNGKTEVITTEKTFSFEKNEGYFMNGNVLSCMRRDPKAKFAVIHTHLFHPTFLSGHFRSVFETKYVNPVIHNKNVDLIELRGNNDNQKKILRMLKQADYLQQTEDSEFQTRSLFSEIWLILIKEIKNQPVHPINLRNQNRIQTMLSCIHQNYMEKLTLKDIAASAAISPRECIRCFQSTIHRSPMEYLTEYRLNAAKKLLLETDMTILEASMQTGFSSNAYFGKVFREKCGITPAEYRASGGSGDRPSQSRPSGKTDPHSMPSPHGNRP